VEGVHAGGVCEELQPLGKIYTGEVCGGLSAMGGTSCCSDRVAWWAPGIQPGSTHHSVHGTVAGLKVSKQLII